MPTLSIVIPCWNRHDLLQNCLDSLNRPGGGVVQVVVVDDGSTPPLEEVISKHLEPQDILFRQRNRGRAAALREGILRATGDFIMLMDSDDEFLPGAIPQVLSHLGELESSLIGLIYRVVDFATARPLGRLPGGVTANLLALRADFGVHGDMKEVISRTVMVESLYDDPDEERRVPTSYIWAKASRLGDVYTVNMPLVRHRYLAEGMTKSIVKLKRENPLWLRRTHLSVACAPSNLYRSRWFRIRSGAAAICASSSSLADDERTNLRESLGWVGYGVAQLVGNIMRLARATSFNCRLAWTAWWS
jgi:glycosyltransferase involved in cell wall biosynthesis